ncbi:hypothetical protein [Cytobacillus firmus]|uniref:hypothetical protein n=1 Tax=Cytobacillus firmus TaxID=1399 RepID=UPI0018CEA6BF|nr:hypothetical protein [Cytobacillus firmus]MBG9587672.1 hypothetical protein [Cytobacillus firmus]
MGRQKKSIKKPGSQIPLKLKENEPNHIVDWFNAQGTIADSIRYLIEKDIAENGIRDVTEEIKQSYSYYKPINKLVNVSSIPGRIEDEKEVRIDFEPGRVGSEPLANTGSNKKSTIPTEVEEIRNQNLKEHSSSSPPRSKKEKLEAVAEEVPDSSKDDLDIDDLNIFG